MSEIRETLVRTMTGVLDGKVPLDTAEAVHKTAHRHVMDRFADDREARRVADEKAVRGLAKAQEMIKRQ